MHQRRSDCSLVKPKRNIAPSIFHQYWRIAAFQPVHIVVGILILLSLSGCGVFSPDIGQSADYDSQQMDRFSNEVLLSNILRARDYLPVNYSDLSSISQTNSTQAGVAFSFPFAALHATSARDTATPSVQLTTTPSANIASLNNTGFVVAMLTPVNPEYIVTKWNNESDLISRKILLDILIKSINLPDPADAAYSTSAFIVNDPQDHSKFDEIINALFKTKTDIQPKSITIMEAIGPPFDLINTSTISTGSPPAPSKVSSLTGLTLATNLNDGQFHIGNAPNSKGQLYHVYSSQAVLCTIKANMDSASKDAFPDSPVPSYTGFSNTIRSLAVMAKGPPSSPSSSPSTTSSLSAASSGSGGVGATPAAQISQALSLNRISALVDKTECAPDEIVVAAQPEEMFAASTKNFVHIEWRSPADIVEYLGAVLRRDEHIGDAATFVASDKKPQGPYLEVFYSSKTYYFSGDSLRVLRIINELINSSKLSSGTQITQPSLFIP